MLDEVILWAYKSQGGRVACVLGGLHLWYAKLEKFVGDEHAGEGEVMKTVGDLLRGKQRDVWSVTPDSTVYEALTLMAEKGIGAVLVLEGHRVVGILSERDYARQVILKGRTSRDTPVSEIMTSRVVYVRPEQSVEDCMALMTDKRIRHLPVMEGEKLVGLVSIGDVVKAVISEKQFIIEQLEHYITRG